MKETLPSKKLKSPLDLTSQELQAYAQAASMDALEKAAALDLTVAGYREGVFVEEPARDILAKLDKSNLAKLNKSNPKKSAAA
jgi:hypothetical protein